MDEIVPEAYPVPPFLTFAFSCVPPPCMPGSRGGKEGWGLELGHGMVPESKFKVFFFFSFLEKMLQTLDGWDIITLRILREIVFIRLESSPPKWDSQCHFWDPQ